MRVITVDEFLDSLDELLRRVETGEEFTITVSGRPAVHLGPPANRHLIGDPQLQQAEETTSEN